MRTLVLVLLALAGCGGGGGGNPGPNPAPGVTPRATIDMAGFWQVSSVNVISTDDPNGARTLLFPGPAFEIGFTNGFYVLYAAWADPTNAYSRSRETLEGDLGFEVDWYENGGDGREFVYGYGWDNLLSPEAGLNSDFTQVGVRLAAASPDILFGFSVFTDQAGFGQPRYSTLAEIVLERVEGP